MYISELHRRRIGLKLVLASIAVSALLVGKATEASVVSPSKWDRTLPALNLGSVKVEATSLPQAWQIVSQRHLVRSILVVSQSSSFQGSFVIDRESLTVGQLMDAIVAAYPGYRWSQDPKTGVLWIYPQEIPYEDLLSATIDVETEQLSVPMQTGILEVLGSIHALGLRVKQWGDLFRNTFDYPVDVPEGVLSVRELLNICAEQNLAKTFFIELLAGGDAIISAVNLGADKLSSPPVGAVRWWHVEIDETQSDMGPSREELLRALSGDDARRRKAARMYLEAVSWQIQFEPWISSIADREEALWLSLAALDILFRIDTGFAAKGMIIDRLRKETTTKFYDGGPPLLALLAAMEIARVGKDPSVLDRVEMRKDLNFEGAEKVELISELARIIRRSEQMRLRMEKSPLPARLGVSPVTIGLTNRNLIVRPGKIKKK